MRAGTACPTFFLPLASQGEGLGVRSSYAYPYAERFSPYRLNIDSFATCMLTFPICIGSGTHRHCLSSLSSLCSTAHRCVSLQVMGTLR